MGVKNRLRHINGSNLSDLELLLEKRIPDAHVIGVNRSGNGEWYIHFLLPSDTYFAAVNDPDELQKLKEFESLKNGAKNGTTKLDSRVKKPRI